MKVVRIGVGDTSALKSFFINDGAELKPYALCGKVTVPWSPLVSRILKQMRVFQFLCEKGFVAPSGNAEFVPPMPEEVAMRVLGKPDPDYAVSIVGLTVTEIEEYKQTWVQYL